MRYRLPTVLVAAALFPPLLGGVWLAMTAPLPVPLAELLVLGLLTSTLLAVVSTEAACA